jgi:hypothetical protein
MLQIEQVSDTKIVIRDDSTNIMEIDTTAGVRVNGTFKVGTSSITSTQLGAIVTAVANGYKIARGVAAVTGTATVATGLTSVVAVIATAASDLDGDTLAGVSATIGDQAGAPVAGSVILKAWKVTGDADVTFIAANAAKNINWLAIGV